MRRLLAAKLNRRSLFAVMSIIGGGVVSACSGPSAAGLSQLDSTPTRDDRDSPVADARSAPTETAMASAPMVTQTAADTPTPTTIELLTPKIVKPQLTPVPIPVETKKLTLHYAPVVSRRLFIHWLSYDELLTMWNGSITDWSQLGEPISRPVKRIGIDGVTPPDPFGEHDITVGSIDELGALLETEHGAIAIIPRELVDFRFRTVRINGVNPWREPDAENPIAFQIPFDESQADELNGLNRKPAMFTFTGDIIFGRFVHKRMEALNDFAAPFRSIYPELTVADITIGDLECSLSDSFPQPEELDPRTFQFKTWTKAIDGLTLAEYDVLSRANNHSFNFGVVGMDDTTAALDGAGIQHFGMGHNLTEARQASVVEVNGVTYAFLGYNGISDAYDGAGPTWAGTAPMVDWMVRDDVNRERDAGHVVIPFFHWGIEYVADPTEQQRYFAHVAIESGASLVIGSHPHWVQALETYQGTPIIYSLGNFVFDQEWSIETKQGMIADIYMRGDQVVEIDLVPILIEDEHRPRLLAAWEGVPVMQRVWDATDRIL